MSQTSFKNEFLEISTHKKNGSDTERSSAPRRKYSENADVTLSSGAIVTSSQHEDNRSEIAPLTQEMENFETEASQAESKKNSRTLQERKIRYSDETDMILKQEEKKKSKENEVIPTQSKDYSKTIKVPSTELKERESVSQEMKIKPSDNAKVNPTQKEDYSDTVEASKTKTETVSSASKDKGRHTDSVKATQDKDYSQVVESSPEEMGKLPPSSNKERRADGVEESARQGKDYSTTARMSIKQEKKQSQAIVITPTQEKEQSSREEQINSDAVETIPSQEKKYNDSTEAFPTQETHNSEIMEGEKSSAQARKQSETSEMSSREKKKYSRSHERKHSSLSRERKYSRASQDKRYSIASQEKRYSRVSQDKKYSIASQDKKYSIASQDKKYSIASQEKKQSLASDRRKLSPPFYLGEKIISDNDELQPLPPNWVVKKKLQFGSDKTDDKILGHRPSLAVHLEHRTCPKTCETFLTAEDFAKIFVDGILAESLVKGREIQQQSSTRIIEGFEYYDDTSKSIISWESTPPYYVCTLDWPTIEDFTVELGIEKIEEYLSFWKFEEAWSYCVKYLGGESDETCDFHRYEAIFSIPCKQYPIPQATASVYFTYEISRVRPKHCLVEVYYSYEGRRMIHTPGKFIFQEEWLFHIIDAKINFYKGLTF